MNIAKYDSIAEWYDESVRTNSLLHDMVVPVLLGLIGNVEDKSICDLACGQGIIARQLAQKGARVTGVDIAEKLLAIAQRYEDREPWGIAYLHDDVQTLAILEDASFDGVLCNMSLMDVADIAAAFRSIRRILRTGGWFVFSITHPCFQTPGSTWMESESGTVSRVVNNYFNERFWYSENASGVRGQVGAYHCMLSTYLNTLIEAGLSLERIVEPQAIGNVAERVPGNKEVPAALVVLCRKR